MNKFASTRINQIKQLQALEDIVVGLQRKYASELVAFNKGMNKTAGAKYIKHLKNLALGVKSFFTPNAASPTKLDAVRDIIKNNPLKTLGAGLGVGGLGGSMYSSSKSNDDIEALVSQLYSANTTINNLKNRGLIDRIFNRV